MIPKGSAMVEKQTGLEFSKPPVCVGVIRALIQSIALFRPITIRGVHGSDLQLSIFFWMGALPSQRGAAMSGSSPESTIPLAAFAGNATPPASSKRLGSG